LGAQRKELSTSDLPDATNFIKQYITAIRNDDFSQFDFEHLPLNSIAVEKNRITENGDYNLSGERYRVNLVLRNKRFEWVCLGDIANISAGNSAPQGDEYFDNGTMPFFRTSDVKKFILRLKIRDKTKDFFNDFPQ
jgi:type I restriction enzyme M protein